VNAWDSWAYRVWIVGGLIGVVVFAIVGATADPGNQDFVFTLIPVIAIWVAGIFILQWRALRHVLRERPKSTEPVAGLLRWSIVFGALLCVAIFAGVYLFYKDPDNTIYPLGDGGPGLPVALIPAFVLVIYGALRTLNLPRSMGSGGGAGDDGEIDGPTDIQAPESPTKPLS
jgi:hypothetical protein